MDGTSLLILAAGIVLGVRHALEPDHLVAVSTLVADRRSTGAGAWAGAAWGLGHALSLLAVAAVLSLFKATLSPSASASFELLVAAMLIALGARALWRAASSDDGAEATAHAHHGHVHVHAASRAHLHVGRWTLLRTPLVVGMIHGLAGSGALTALVASRLPGAGARIVYVALFGAGSILGMGALSVAAGAPLEALGRRPHVASRLLTIVGALSCAVGFAWAVEPVRSLLS